MLSDYWYIVYESKKLGKSPVSITLFDQSIVLFRSFGAKVTAKVTALENRCAHRNAPLSAGKIEKNCIVCPYHGWKYDAVGNLKENPSKVQDKNFKPEKKIKIRKYSVVEQQGFIWLSFKENIKSKPLLIPNYKQANWSSFLMITDFPAPVDSCLENFLDCPHATTVHNKWFRSPTSTVIDAELRTNSDGAEVEYFKEPRKQSIIWSLLNRKETTMRHIDKFIAPATSQVDYIFSDETHYTITSFCSPISNDKTRVYTIMNYKVGWLTKLIRLFFEPLSRTIIKQDLNIIKKQQRNIKKFGKEKFLVTETDLIYPSIKQWRKALEKGLEKPRTKRNKRVKIRL